MVTRLAAGRLLVAIGVLGILASFVAIALGRQLVTQADEALGRSLALTAETLESLESSITLAQETLDTVGGGLEQAESTTRTLTGTLDGGADVLLDAAEVTDERIAEAMAAVEDNLPPVVEVAGAIDAVLTELNALPLGPSYEPEEPFALRLQALQRGMEGVAEDLREQAALIQEAGENLGEVGDGTAAIAADLVSIRASLSEAADLLGNYETAAVSASELVAETRDDLGAQARRARMLVTLLGLTVAAGQVVPLGTGWALLRPPEARPLLREP